MLVIFLLSGHAIAQDEVIDHASILSRYLQYSSFTGEEVEAAAYFMEKCREMNLHVELLTDGEDGVNFTASVYPLDSSKPNIVFLNYIDVAEPGDTGLWTHHPFSGAIIDDMVWGRGAADGKGLAVAQLMAVANIAELYEGLVLPFNATILCLSGREIGGVTGAKVIADRYLDKLNPMMILADGGFGMRNVVKHDPSRPVFGISTIDKTRLVLELELEADVPSHVSVPPRTYAAVELMQIVNDLLKKNRKVKFDSKISANTIKNLGKAEKGMKGFVQRNYRTLPVMPFAKKQIHKDPLLASMFMNTITLKDMRLGETNRHQLSNKATAVLECRLLPEQSADDLIRWMEKKLRKTNVKVNKVYEDDGGSRTKFPLYYVMMCKSLKMVHTRSLNLEIMAPEPTGSRYFRDKDIPVFGLFPAIFTEEQAKSIRGIDERISIQQLDDSIDFYRIFLDRMVELHVEAMQLNMGAYKGRR